MDDEGNLGAAIAAGGAVAASAINAGSQERTNRWQMQLAKYSYEQQRQMIAEQNAYNSPLAQLKRYEEAGLNPNLIYGEGKASAGNQSEIAKYNVPNLVSPNVGQIGSTLMDAVRLQMEMAQNRADLRIKNEQASNLKLLGNKYNQDYYTQLLHNIEESELLGYNPGLLMTPEEMERVRGSRKIQAYDQNLRIKNIEVDLKKAQSALYKADAKTRNWVLDNMLPVQLEIEKKRDEGMSFENAIKEVQAELEKNLSKLGASSGGVKLLIDLLRTFIKR